MFDCRVIQKKRPVTKGYVERKKLNPTFSVFGAGKGNDNLRMNATITMVQRDNIWHPYYEIKVEEEDLGTKFKLNRTQNVIKQDDQDISNLQKKIDELQKEDISEENKKDNPSQVAPKKKLFDMKSI